MTSQHQRFATFALVLVIALVGATSVASASPVGTAGTYSVPPASTQASTSAPTPAPVANAAPDQGFDWGDAVIGAGIAVAISVIGFGGAMMLRSHRPSHHGSPATS